MTTNTYKQFVFYIGYDETRSVSCVHMHHVSGFPSVQEALLNLKNSIRQYLETCATKAGARPCPTCIVTVNTKYCPNCGRHIQQANKIQETEICTNFGYLFRWDYDASYPFIEYLDTCGWEIGIDYNDFPIVEVYHTEECLRSRCFQEDGFQVILKENK